MYAYIITLIKMLSSSERASLAHSLRTDPEAWNASKGVAGVATAVRGVISGTVTNAAGGAAVANCTVMAYDASGNAYYAKTAADGTYTLYAPAATYTLVFGAATFDTATTSSVVLAASGTSTQNKALTASA
jgi:hypothetical protein